MVCFAILLGLTVSPAGGFWPARRALRRSLAWGSRSAAGVAAVIPARLSRSILASELAVATIVMVGTLFIGVGIWRYLHQPLGFDYDDRFWVRITRAEGQPVTPVEIEAVLCTVRELPGIRASGPSRLSAIRGVEIPERAVDPKLVSAVGATQGYFDVWNLRLRAGRWFVAREFAGDEPVAVVDQKLARLAWFDGEALGQEIRVGGVLRRVVGVIEPKRESLSREMPGQVYVPVYVPAAQPSRWASTVAWAVALVAVAILAATVPARRAMRIDPAVTLRME